jgi:hypothetical protein
VTLSFRLGRIPVRIHAMFFLVSGMLGASGGDMASILISVATVFVSVLIH